MAKFICVACGSTFTRPPSARGKHGPDKVFCSLSCAAKSRKREATPHWKGGKYRHSAGYILCLAPNHPRASVTGYVYEHIMVAELMLGRVIAPSENVHHLNGIRDDNRPENLVVIPMSHHSRVHSFKRIRDHKSRFQAG